MNYIFWKKQHITFASNGIQQYTICQGVPTGGIYQDKVIAAYFTNANYEMAVLTKN